MADSLSTVVVLSVFVAPNLEIYIKLGEKLWTVIIWRAWLGCTTDRNLNYYNLLKKMLLSRRLAK